MQVEAKAHFNLNKSISTFTVYMHDTYDYTGMCEHFGIWQTSFGCILRPYDTRYVKINVK